MRRVIEVILCIFVGVFFFGIFAITFQVIGGDSANKAAIIGGVLSMLGGAIGAFGAYFIAKWQMNVLLERQYEKEKSKFTWEIKVNKKLEVIQLLYNKINEFELFKKEYTKYNAKVGFYLRSRRKDDIKINVNVLLQNVLEETKKCNKMMKDFNQTFRVLFTFKSFYSEDFNKIIQSLEDDLLDFYQNLAMYINFLNYPSEEYLVEELYHCWLRDHSKMDDEILIIESKLLAQLDYLMTEVSEMLPNE
ncbi:hypothetical protein [Lysinibacillus xylanilyticus]|uniref:hypothetical protein n=1 Tax=Lysinibacillus xylanilyticus TaxID=582475 RepID=UPI003CFDE243